MEDFYNIRETAMALHVDQREYLGFVLLRSLAGISEKEIENDQRARQIDSGLMQAALSLPEKQRHSLSVWLTMSTEEGPLDEWVVSPEERDEAWGIEIARRVRESDEGKVKSIPWEEVKQNSRELVRKLSECPERV